MPSTMSFSEAMSNPPAFRNLSTPNCFVGETSPYIWRRRPRFHVCADRPQTDEFQPNLAHLEMLPIA
jgi:hypothetical protein